MKKIFNFVKNNIFMFLAIYLIVQFAIGLIKFDPSSSDMTARKIKAIELGMDLIWALIFIGEQSFYKIINLIEKRIDLVDKQINFLYAAFATEPTNSKEEEKSENEDNKQI